MNDMGYRTYALPLIVLILRVVTWATHSTQSYLPLNTKLPSWEGLPVMVAALGIDESNSRQPNAAQSTQVTGNRVEPSSPRIPFPA